MITANKTARAITVIGYCLLVIVLASCSGDGSQMRAQLEELERQNRADSVMTNDSLAELLVKYFDRHGTPNERMRAHYLMGRTWADMGDYPNAVEAFLTATYSADTMRSDCDFFRLSRVYGQMSNLFYKQHLLEECLENLKYSSGYAWKANDTTQALTATAFMIPVLFKLHQDDKAISLYDTLYAKAMLFQGIAAVSRYCMLPVEHFLETKDYQKAKEAIECYETYSCYFDSCGNIEKGREVFYYYKGLYYLNTLQYDSAEFFFRKELREGHDFNNQNAAARGLALLYHQINRLDSAVKYSLYSYAMNDSSYNRSAMEEMQRARSLYDYSHHQAIANREHKRADQEKAQKNRLYVVLLFVLAIVLITWFLLARKRRLEAERIRQLNQALSSAKREQQIVMKELDDLKAMNYDELISQKEQQRLNLQKYIAQLEGTSGKVSLRDFKESQIVKTFAEKSQFSKDHPVPNQAEWDMLEQQFGKDMPGLCRLFEDKGLSDLEFRTCLLLLLDYDEGTVAGLTQSSSQTINSAKVRANQKLFNEKGAKTLHRALKKLI